MNLLEKWILGLSGARDEAQQKAISSIGLQGYIVTYLVGCIALIISFRQSNNETPKSRNPLTRFLLFNC